MTAPSAADLAATVRAGIRIHPDEPTDVMVDLEARALAALDDLVARCEQAERNAERLREAAYRMTEKRDTQMMRAEQAERKLDEAREWGHRQADLLTECATACEAAEARVAQLEAPVRPFMSCPRELHIGAHVEMEVRVPKRDFDRAYNLLKKTEYDQETQRVLDRLDAALAGEVGA